jgi:hypothetical protein
MQNEEKTLEIFMSNLSIQLGKQAYRITELETLVELKNQEIENLKAELESKKK